MKNRFFFTLIIAVLCVFLISASGEALRTYCVEFPHRLERNYDSYVQAFPNLEIASDNTWYDDTSELLSALKSANPPFDLFQLSISIYGSRRIMSEGMCTDLSGSAVIQEAASRLWPSLRQQLIFDGKLYAVPDSVLLSSFTWCEDAWQAAGLAGTPAPSCYTELLDFLEQWVARVKHSPVPDVRVSSMFDESLYNRHSYVRYLVEVLLDCYMMPHFAKGRTPVFDTPEFRALLDRAVALGRALYDAEPQKIEGMKQLFENNLSAYSILPVKGGYSHAMPLRVSPNQPALHKAAATLVCMGAGGQNQALATRYLEHKITHLASYAGTYAFMDSQPLMRENLEADIADQQQRVLKTQSQLNKGGFSAPRRNELTEQLRRQTRVLESMQTEEWKYLVSARWLAEYNKVAPTLFFPPHTPLLMREAWQLKEDFSTGKISTDQFIKQLDRLANQSD